MSRLGLGYQLKARRRMSGGASGPVIDTGPMEARRSIKFPLSNGNAGTVALTMPAITDFFRSGAAFEAHELFMRLSLNPQAHRSYTANGVPTTNNLTIDHQIFGLVTSSVIHIRVGGVNSTTDAGALAGRIRVRLGSAGSLLYSPRLWEDGAGNWFDLPSYDFAMFICVDGGGTNAFIRLVRPDGTVEDGTPVALGAWTGTVTTGVLRVGASTNAAGPFNGLQNGALSDVGYIRRRLTDAERLRIGQGEEVGDVLGASFAGFHYRLSGVNDLAKTNGTDSMTDMTLYDSGQTTAGLFRLHSGGTICGKRNVAGTAGLTLHHDKLWDGLVFGKDRTTNTGSIQIPITNTGSAASHFEARLMTWPMDNSNPVTTVTPWVQITSSPLAAGASVVGTLSHTAGPWRQVEVRSVSDNTIRASSMVTGIGTVVEFHGQSEIEFHFTFVTIGTDTALREANTPLASVNMVSYVKNQCRAANTYTSRARVERARCEGTVAGYGVNALAVQWQQLYPNECAMFINFAVEGQPRTTWTTNAALPGTAYLSYGTLGTPASGEAADIQLATFPDATKWATSGAVFYPSVAESSTEATAVSNFNGYFYGTGSPTRSFKSIYDLRTVSATPIMVVPHGRAFRTTSSASNAVLVTERDGWLARFAGVETWADTAAPTGFTTRRLAPNNVILYADGDAIHPALSVLRSAVTVSGRMWFAKAFIHALEQVGNLYPSYDASTLALPATFTRDVPNTGTVLTIALPSSALGNWSRRAGTGNMDRLWLISTDAGSTWSQLVNSPVAGAPDIGGTSTLSSNVVTLTIPGISAVSDANLRVQYFQMPMTSSASTNPQYATSALARTDENLLIDGLLVIPDARFTGPEVVGYPLFDTDKILTPA